MHCTRKVSEHVIWVGCDDRRLDLFEHLFPIPRGVSYNSYLILDEKTVLMDTVDASVTEQFIENLDFALSGRTIDYLVVHHMEPDHCANIQRLMHKFPKMQVVATGKAIQMIGQFFELDLTGRTVTVKEGDSLSIGEHTLHFKMAPMVHWPEVMVTFEEKEHILFSADAFGTFGALNGNLFNDEVDFEKDWIDDARRYYSNIVGKYGTSVQALLKKLAPLDIHMICPLHGPVWRSNLSYFIDKHNSWSSYQPEDQAAVILYGSIYGHTEQGVNALVSLLGEKGISKVAAYDISTTHVSELIAQIFRCSHIVLACPTYNGGLFPPMENLLSDMKALSVQKRTVALIENGTWAPTAARLMRKELEEMKEIQILDTTLTIQSTLKSDRAGELEEFAAQIVESLQE